MDSIEKQYENKPIRSFIYRRSFAGFNGMYALKHPHIALKRLGDNIVDTIKRNHQRKKYHFSNGDIWSFCDVNARAQVHAIDVLLKNLHGYPSSLVVDRELSEINYHSLSPTDKAKADVADKVASDKWRNILTTMRDGWQAFIEMDELAIESDGIEGYKFRRAVLQQRFDDGIALYVKYYGDLWD